MAQEAIWPGSSSFAVGETPYGFYDTDTDFSGSSVHSVDRFADWAARRLGFPIMSVELQEGQFYACYEESITEYSAQVNQFNIKDNLLHLTGQATGSNVTHKKVTPTLGRTVTLSKQYGTEAMVGGNVDIKKGSINVTSGSQEYDLNKLFVDGSTSGSIEVKRVYYEATPAMQRFFDPYATTGYGTINMVSGFGFGNYSPAVSFTLMPLFEDLLRVQAIELNDSIRKSAYTFSLVNNKLRIFPDPEEDRTVFFDYVVTSERDNPLITEYSGSADVVSDFSNVPYDNMEFKFINDVGKQWIKKYGLALCKELLGIIRGKYGTIPIPNSDTTLDGDTLRAEASAEKETLVTQLREMLEQTSRKALLEADKDEAEFLQEKLQKVPYPIYIG
ncbi:MAG: hypothetical protein CBD26_00295 [Candidatus Pelagibacter sp. TMED166]|nr:MAG: hypothetical protein CBD26_00295 [Candidatus Pelagibacter sp. TMED166]|tara:strand:- start:3873 stop:5036 length:1164 start_codon:yes stop_codon:yes gene_type:complete